MKGLMLALATVATMGIATSSAFADTGAVAEKPTTAKVQHTLLTPNSSQGEVQPVVRWGWGHRGFYGGFYRPYYGYGYGYGFHRPYYGYGYYRPYYGYYGYYRPYYGYYGYYRPYYWWY